MDVAVVGAGIAGLLAARRLTDAGLEVVVLDKGREVGGRLATRRVGGGWFDHGAQFFTVRTPEFAELTTRWLAEGVAREWCRGFGDPNQSQQPDGYPRYVGAHGMPDLAKDVARGLDVRTGSRVTSIRRDGATWTLEIEGGGERTAAAVICTTPVPQTLELLGAGDVAPDPSARAALARIRYEPCFALLAVLDRASVIPPPGGVQLEDGPFRFIGDNQAKGISDVPAVTFHASGAWSGRRLEDDPAVVSRDLLAEARRWLGGAEVVEAQLVRWRYSRPIVLHDRRCLVAARGTLVCAGDAFGEAKVEGAARSGWGAADEILSRR